MKRSIVTLAAAFACTGAEILLAQAVRAPPPAMPPLEAEKPAVATAYGTPRETFSLLLAPAVLSIETSWKEAADSLDNVSVDVSAGYEVVVDGVQVEGSGAFHLAHPGGTSLETILLNPSFAIASDTRLFFESRLGIATGDQVAEVQLSSNGGASWELLWSRAGTGWPGQTGYERVSLPLAAYAGETVMLRFRYRFSSGSYYPGIETHYGWLIDDIQLDTEYRIKPELYSIGDPTGEEQQSLEFINRARASAGAEAIRLRDTDDPDAISAMNYFNVDKVMLTNQFASLTQTLPPLAFSAKLIAAARLHSQDMYENGFQGHVSSTNPPPPNQPGDTLGTRLSRQDYSYSTAGENVYAYAKSVWYAHAGFNVDWGDGPGGMQDPPGHRLNIHSASYREVGIGIVEGSSESVGPMLVTQDFGTEQNHNQPYLTGVAWNDQNLNGFYDPGEGLEGIEVSVEGERHMAVSTASGGFAVPVFANGTYTVSFGSEEYPDVSTTVTVSNLENAKVDYRLDQIPPLQLAGLGPVAGGLRLTVQTEAASPILQSSTNLTDWVDRPDLLPQDQGGGVFWFDVVPALDAEFFRAKAAF